jgi:hypothetical protein
VNVFLVASFPDQPISIRISAGEQDLEEEHHRGPDRRGAPEPWQDEFPDHRLDLEEQECRKENADSEESHIHLNSIVPRIIHFQKNSIEATGQIVEGRSLSMAQINRPSVDMPIRLYIDKGAILY